MQFDHFSWRTGRAYIHDITRGGSVEVLSEMPGTLTIIGRGTSRKQAVEQVQAEAARRGLIGAPDPTDYPGIHESLDTWCAATWIADAS